MAAVPTPDAPACTSAHRPAVSPPCTTSASHAVRYTSGTAPASVSGSAARHREELALVDRDLLGVGAPRDDAHDRVALRPRGDPCADATTRPASSMPGISWALGGPGSG